MRELDEKEEWQSSRGPKANPLHNQLIEQMRQTSDQEPWNSQGVVVVVGLVQHST